MDRNSRRDMRMQDRTMRRDMRMQTRAMHHDMRMRDRNSRMNDMTSGMRDNTMHDRNYGRSQDMYMNDGRNPYGSAGGYVIDGYSTRSSMDFGNYSRNGDYARNPQSDHERGNRDYERTREYHGAYGNTPFYVTNREDFGESKLSKEDLGEWIEKLTHELMPEEKEMFKMDKVIKKAEHMGEKFNKYNEDELYVTTLMMYTDYKNYIGKNNVDTAIGMAKDFLCDPDASKKYGEKLAIYFDEIIMDD